MHRLETMSYKIIIKELRSIKYLEFDVPTSGVHILTGCNGCGKTSLLITLNRICNNTAFSSLKLGRKVGMDKFSSTRITYTNGTSIITYKRTNRGWEPTPSKAKPSDIFPFADCRFITTSGFRFFEPNPDNFYKTGGGHVAYADAPVEIKEGLNKIFDTQKFNNLKYVKIRSMHGRQKKLHRNNILYVIKDAGNVYSEMNFSLGERLVLNTLDYAQGVPNNSLLLIDEIELALHPTAQVKFYEYVQDLAQRKSLTCILSTHSGSLIKAASKRLHLENRLGVISVLKDCEPSYILKELTVAADNRPDYLFLVEDIMAWRYLNAILRKYQRTEDKYKLCQIAYVGGYEQVIQLAETFYRMPPFSKRAVQVFPDADVQQEWDRLKLKVNRTPAEEKKLQLLNTNHQNISILDITPELGVWEWLTADASKFESSFINAYGNQLFRMTDVVNTVSDEEIGKSPGNPREHAKGCFKNLVEKLRGHVPASSEGEIFDILFRSYAEDKLSDINKFDHWKSIFKLIFNRH